MQPDPYPHDFIGKLHVKLDEISEQLAAEEAPVSMFRQHYNELLQTALATGELAFFDDQYYIDPDTGLLAANFHLHIPKRAPLILP